ncbi:MAG: hypothetical protein H8Z69_02735 [Nanohaloarchaea archaeon]|nr:hypothetical protein [Candidatus Nanohaloarchaea archaeon]
MGAVGARKVDGKYRKQLWGQIGVEDEHTEEDPHPVAKYLEQAEAVDRGYALPEAEEVLQPNQRDDYCCNADRIDKKPHSARERIWWRNNEGDYVVETVNMKGHEYRDMAVYRQHGVIPTENSEWDEAVEHLFSRAALQVRNDPEVSNDLALFVGLNDIPNHHHIVVSDIDGGQGETLSDLEQIDNFALYDLSGDEYSIEKPDYFEIGDKRGEIGLEPYIT